MANEETQVVTVEDARKAAEDYRRAELDLQRIESTIKARKAAIDAEYEETIADLTLLQNDSREKIAAYAEAKRDELLDGKKSTTFYGLNIGWKITPPKLTLRRAKDTWDKVMQRIRESKVEGNYISVKESIDKTALKKADPEFLAQIGVEFQQEEQFVIKL